MLIPEVVELLSDETGKGGADHGTGQGSLRDAGGPQIDVIGSGVSAGVGSNGLQ